MYKLLLSWRYLRTRYIALASVISVTLGVATLIVVNSVMAGFTNEMHKRLHSILSDLVFEAHSLGGFPDAEYHIAEIRDVLGDDIEGMTATVHVPAMLNFQVNGKWITRQVNLIGIDDTSYDQVSDFGKYLLHPDNQQQIRFALRSGGYDREHPELDGSGWEHRRRRVLEERAYHQLMREAGMAPQEGKDRTAKTTVNDSSRRGDAGSTPRKTEPDPIFRKINPPRALAETEGVSPPQTQEEDTSRGEEPQSDASSNLPIPSGALSSFDPFARGRPGQHHRAAAFDRMKQQYTGVILGINIASVRRRMPDNSVKDFFLCRPGDDVQITLPTASTPPKAVNQTFTVVDFYESKMSEYDSTFAFMPLKKLQELRDMVNPATGVRNVTSIQIRLKPGADLEAARDRLRAKFPPEIYPYRIQTWKDLQGPLLAAVSLETTLLNILLFLIIAVAGFGILATFFMIVVEKTRDIGILKALGAPNRGVMSIFLSYGLLLGVAGSGVGMVLGLLFVARINDVAALIEMITGREVFDPTVYYFREIPTIVDPLTVAWIMTGSVLIAILASVLPALRAAWMHPVEALRYE